MNNFSVYPARVLQSLHNANKQIQEGNREIPKNFSELEIFFLEILLKKRAQFNKILTPNQNQDIRPLVRKFNTQEEVIITDMDFTLTNRIPEFAWETYGFSIFQTVPSAFSKKIIERFELKKEFLDVFLCGKSKYMQSIFSPSNTHIITAGNYPFQSEKIHHANFGFSSSIASSGELKMRLLKQALFCARQTGEIRTKIIRIFEDLDNFNIEEILLYLGQYKEYRDIEIQVNAVQHGKKIFSPTTGKCTEEPIESNPGGPRIIEGGIYSAQEYCFNPHAIKQARQDDLAQIFFRKKDPDFLKS